MSSRDDLPERIRAFVAIRLGAEVEDTVAGFIEPLRAIRSGVRWVRPAQLHVTLRFLGAEVPSAQIPPLDQALTALADGFPPFPVDVRGTGAFPNLQRPRVVWVGLDSGQLMALAERIEGITRECGFSPEPRPFTAHLTIGRVRDFHGWLPLKQRLREAAAQNFGRADIEAVILYRSILGADSSRYEEIGRYQLRPRE